MQSFLFGTLWLVILIDFCIALYKYKNLPLVLKAAAWFLVLVFIRQTAIFILLYLKQNNLFLFHIGVITDAVPLLLMYREMFKKHIEEKEVYVYRKIFIVLITFFVVFAIVNALCWQPLNTYPSNTRTVLSLIIVILSIQYHIMITARATRYYYLSGMNINISDYGDQKEIPAFKLTQAPMFWITTGLLLFHSFALFSYLFINRFQKELSEESLKDISLVYTVFAIILFVFIAIGIFKAKRIIVVDDESNVDNKQ